MKRPMETILFTAALIVPFVVATSAVHVSVKNSLGSGKNMTLHCLSKEDDLGPQVIANGNEFGWSFSPNIWRTTLFYCQLDQGSLQGFEFDAYSYGRDFIRCVSECRWLVAVEGMYCMNNQTGLWEYEYQWPHSSS